MKKTAAQKYREEYCKPGLGKAHATFRVHETPGLINYVDITLKNVPKPINVKTWLDVGAGSGDYLYGVLQRLPNVTFDFNDVSPEQAALFKKLISKVPEKKQLGEVFVCPFQKIPTKSYELITASHSWYGIEDMQKPVTQSSIPKLYSMIKQGGRAVLLLATRENFLEHLRDTFYERIHGCRGLVCTADDLMERLDYFGYKYTHETFSEAFVVEDYVSKGKLTKVGKSVFQAIVHSRFDSLDSNLQSEITDFLSKPKSKVSNKSEAIIIRK